MSDYNLNIPNVYSFHEMKTEEEEGKLTTSVSFMDADKSEGIITPLAKSVSSLFQKTAEAEVDLKKKFVYFFCFLPFSLFQNLSISELKKFLEKVAKCFRFFVVG